MKSIRKRSLALFLCLLSLVLTVSAAGARDTVYFMAVNDTPLELSASTMPIRSGNAIYVPYYVFSASSTGVNLGTYVAYNTARGQLLVYSSRKQLTFDLVDNYAYDGDGSVYSSYAIVRGSTVYLPVSLVCSVFSDTLRYSVSNTQYGILVRVKNASVVLEDREFIAAASSRMSSMLTRYLQENPSPSVQPTPTPTPVIAGKGARVYPAFTLTAPEGTDPAAALSDVLSALERLKVQGLFFLTPEEIAGQDDLVRRLVGLGHLVGVRLTGSTAGEALEELDRAKELLSAVARCRPCAVLPEALGRKELDQLSQGGCPCWRTTLDGRKLEGTAVTRAKALISTLAVGADERNYLLLDGGSGETLRAVLETLTEADFRLAAPVPTEL